MRQEIGQVPDISDVNENDNVSIECDSYGHLVGVQMRRVQGEANALDTPTMTLNIYNALTADPDFLLFSTTFDGADLLVDRPIWDDQTPIDAWYESVYKRVGHASQEPPQLLCVVDSTGLNNPVVAAFRYRIRLDTKGEHE